MAKLLHEIWVEDTSFGPIPSMVLAGPDGDTFRHGLATGARLVLTFEAGNNFEAMTAFYQYNGWGAYQLNLPDDQKPYPESWLKRQGLTKIRVLATSDTNEALPTSEQIPSVADLMPEQVSTNNEHARRLKEHTSDI